MRFPARASILFTSGLIATAAALSCSGPPNSNSVEHAAANAGINLLLTNQPVPIFATSALRTNGIQVEAIQALGTPTTTFFFPEGTVVTSGKYSAPPFKICPSQGEPIHASDSITNPQQVTSGNGAVVGQMDPNGIYAGPSTGTYVLCLNASGQPEMSYWEGMVEAETGTAVWNPNGGPGQQIQDVGPSQLPVCTLQHAGDGNDPPGLNLKAGTAYYHCTPATTTK